jgi:phospholipid/cholesterol/gamma-HCH transport system ATP-binding protein
MAESNKESAQAGAMISVRDLRVQYGEREILHGVTFDVERAQTLVILGGSGSGKSTLLRTLVGLERPSAGQIWMRGQDIATFRSRCGNTRISKVRRSRSSFG